MPDGGGAVAAGGGDWHYYSRDAAAKTQQVAGWMAGLLSWTEAQQEGEIARYGQSGR